jgi:hypothetical protein
LSPDEATIEYMTQGASGVSAIAADAPPQSPMMVITLCGLRNSKQSEDKFAGASSMPNVTLAMISAPLEQSASTSASGTLVGACSHELALYASSVAGGPWVSLLARPMETKSMIKAPKMPTGAGRLPMSTYLPISNSCAAALPWLGCPEHKSRAINKST